MKFKAFIVYGILLLAVASILSILIFNADKKTIAFSDLEKDETILVKVQGNDITSSDLKKAVDITTFKPLDNKEKMANLLKILQELVRDKILSNLADEKNISASEKEVQGEIDRLLSQYGEDAFNRLLESQNMTMAEFKIGVNEELVKRKLAFSISTELKAEIEIPQADIESFYQQNKEMYNISDLAHIYIQIQPPFGDEQLESANENALSIIDKLSNGSDFAAIARRFSDDASTKDNGGFLGPMSRGNLAVAIREAAGELKEGVFSKQPLRIQSGFIIIKKLNSRYRTIEEVEQEIRDRILEPKLAQSYSNYIKEVETEAEVNYYFKFEE